VRRRCGRALLRSRGRGIKQAWAARSARIGRPLAESAMRRPKVRRPIPGRLSKAILKRGDKRGSLPACRPYPLVVDQAEGCWVVDPDGNELLDMTAGGGVCLLGHRHPELLDAVRRQLDRVVHFAPSGVSDPLQVDLAEGLGKLGATRGKKQRVYFGATGSEVVRAAIELSRHHTERETILAFTDSLEGPDLDGVAVTHSKVIEQSGLAPLVSGVFHASYPDPLRHGDEAIAQALEQVLTILGKLVSPDNVAALLVEPMQHEGGFVVPPAGFLAALRRLCDQHDMLLICNEIQTGLGRTGKLFGWQHEGIEPDLVCLAGGMGGGLPLGALVGRSELMGWPPGTRPGAFGGNPLACAAALALFDLLEEGLVERAVRMGDRLGERLEQAVGSHAQVGQVRGLGLLRAVEFVTDREGLEPDPRLRNTVLQECFRSGVLLHACGPSSVAFGPALTVEDEALDVAVEIFAEEVHKANG
jgi:4-aminobutyrate aminotransferase